MRYGLVQVTMSSVPIYRTCRNCGARKLVGERVRYEGTVREVGGGKAFHFTAPRVRRAAAIAEARAWAKRRGIKLSKRVG